MCVDPWELEEFQFCRKCAVLGKVAECFYCQMHSWLKCSFIEGKRMFFGM